MTGHTNHMEKLVELEKKVREAERLQIQAESRKNSLKEQLDLIEKEIKSIGVDPNNLMSEISNIEKELEQGIRQIEELLPMDLLK